MAGSLKVNKPKLSSNTVKVTWSCSFNGVKSYDFVWYYRAGSADSSKTSAKWKKLSSGNVKKKTTSVNISSINAIDDIKITVTAKDKKNKKIGSAHTSKVLSLDKATKPSTPSAPTIVEATADKITVNYERASNSTGIIYQLLSDAKKLSNGSYYYDEVASSIIETSDYIPWTDLRNAPHSFFASRGDRRFVRCRLVKRVWYKNNTNGKKYSKDFYSVWGSISDEVMIRPPKPSKPTKITSQYKNGLVFLYWNEVKGATKGYDIQSTHFVNSEGEPIWISEENIISTVARNVGYWSFNMDLSTPPYFFRIRSKNDATAYEGKSDWSDYIQLNTGKVPDPPTVWLLKNSIEHGDVATFYFTHNTADGSEMTDAILHIEGNINVDYRYSDRKSDPQKAGIIDPDSETPTYYFKIDTNNYSERTFSYKMKTKGGYLDPGGDGFGEYSEQKEFTVYTKPVLSFSESPDLIESLPFSIKMNAEPTAQKAITYALSIVALEPYSYTNSIGDEEIVQAGDEVYSEVIVANSNEQVVSITSEKVQLRNVKYNISATVHMDSGLEASCEKDIYVDISQPSIMCDADVEVNDEYLYASITPKAYYTPYEIAPDYILCDPKPTEFEYLNNPNAYYYLDIEEGYVRCEVYDRYDPLKAYYTIGFTENQFNANKKSYYIFDNENDMFVQCDESTEYSDEETYYRPVIFIDEMEERFNDDPTSYYIYDGFVNCLPDKYSSQYGKEFDSRFEYYKEKYIVPENQPVLDTWNNGFGWYIYDDRFIPQGGTEFDSSNTYYNRLYNNSIIPTDTWNDGIGWYLKAENENRYIEQSTMTYVESYRYFRPSDSIQPSVSTWNDGVDWYLYDDETQTYINQSGIEFDTTKRYFSFVDNVQPEYSWNHGINWYIYNELTDEYIPQTSSIMDHDAASDHLYFYNDPDSIDYYVSGTPQLDSWNNGVGWYIKNGEEYVNQSSLTYDSTKTYYILDGFENAYPTEQSWNNGFGLYLFVEGTLYSSTTDYYEIDENGDYILVHPSMSEFNLDKSRYYYIGIRQCTEEDSYNSQILYYIPSVFEEVLISLDDYEYDPNKYYIYDNKYIKCGLSDPYDPTQTYYIMGSLDGCDVKESFFLENKTAYYVYSSSQKKYIQCEETDAYDPNTLYFRPPDRYDVASNLASDVYLSVYRRNYDGSFTLVAANIQNAEETVLDLHPALDYARYRVVSINALSGEVNYSDIPDVYIGNKSIVLQWNDDWVRYSRDETIDYDVVQHDPNETSITSRLELPYNISISENTNPDVALQEYIGREDPVSYFGTQLGIGGSWSTEIDKKDSETIFQLRRLQRWKGNVYVREPSGIGYWAVVRVSMSNSYNSLITPISIEVTKVEGDTI